LQGAWSSNRALVLTLAHLEYASCAISRRE